MVMESTGRYWGPVLNVLEDDPEYELRVVLSNPQQVKAVTGHKTTRMTLVASSAATRDGAGQLHSVSPPRGPAYRTCWVDVGLWAS